MNNWRYIKLDLNARQNQNDEVRIEVVKVEREPVRVVEEHHYENHMQREHHQECVQQ